MINAPEPIHFAIWQHLFNDVKDKLAAWSDQLTQKRLVVAEEFARDIRKMRVPDGTSFADYAEAQADLALDRWCKRRGEFAQEIVALFNPETVAISQHLGVAAELGQLVGLHLDNAVRDLDRDLRRLAGIAG